MHLVRPPFPHRVMLSPRPQVRNLRSCIKVAVDFVSPEALHECAAMAARLAKIPRDEGELPEDSLYGDKLQVGAAGKLG